MHQFVGPITKVLRKIRIKERVNSQLDAFKTIVTLGFCTFIGQFLYEQGFKETIIIVLFVLGIIYVAFLTTKRRYCIIASIGGILLFDWLFSAPRFSLALHDLQSLLILIIVFFTSLLTGEMTSRFREQERLESLRLKSTETLLETSHHLQKATDYTSAMLAICTQLETLNKKPVNIYYFKDELLMGPIFSDSGEVLPIKKLHMRRWLLSQEAPRELIIDCGEADILFLKSGPISPIKVIAGTELSSLDALSVFEKDLIIAMLDETVLAMEKLQLDEINKQIITQAEAEKVRSDFLRAVSHDLRTPLTGISGSAEMLLKTIKDEKETLSIAAKTTLYQSIYNDAEWLISMVENLLFVTRIENGTMIIHTEAELFQEVILEALSHVSKKKSEHNIIIDIPDDLLMAIMDARLIMHVIINIVDNAIKYTDKGSTIKVSAFEQDGEAIIEISDNGKGVPDDEKEKVFEMFHTTSINKEYGGRGTGLGLYLCRSIAEAHGGRIYVRDNTPHGAIFGFALPIERVNIE